MSETTIHFCPCPTGQGDTPHAEREVHRQMHVVLSRLDAQQRRWDTAREGHRFGHGGAQLMSHIPGLDPHPIRRGRQALAVALRERPAARVRARGAGRPRTAKKTRGSTRFGSLWSRPKPPVRR